MIQRHIFWEVQKIIKANPKIQKSSAFYGFLGNACNEHGPFNWYLTGISLLATTNVHVDMVWEAFHAFYTAWKTAIVQYNGVGEDADLSWTIRISSQGRFGRRITVARR